MVHWLGEGTNVMLCLAREPPPSPSEEYPDKVTPSSVYISFDNGDTFLDRSELFQVNVNGTEKNTTLDQFMTHPNYNTVSKGFMILRRIIWPCNLLIAVAHSKRSNAVAMNVIE